MKNTPILVNESGNFISNFVLFTRQIRYLLFDMTGNYCYDSY